MNPVSLMGFGGSMNPPPSGPNRETSDPNPRGLNPGSPVHARLTLNSSSKPLSLGPNPGVVNPSPMVPNPGPVGLEPSPDPGVLGPNPKAPNPWR